MWKKMGASAEFPVYHYGGNRLLAVSRQQSQRIDNDAPVSAVMSAAAAFIIGRRKGEEEEHDRFF